MDALQISKILKKDPFTRKWFRGFSTPDLDLPASGARRPKTKTPELYVLNTDSYKGPGIHWCVAIFPPGGKPCEFFDPLGKPPQEYKFHGRLFKKSKVVRFMEFPVQATTSSTCGHHCLFFAYYRSRGLSKSRVIKKYSRTNLTSNDEMVFNFVKKMFPKYVSVSTVIPPSSPL